MLGAVVEWAEGCRRRAYIDVLVYVPRHVNGLPDEAAADWAWGGGEFSPVRRNASWRGRRAPT